MCVGGDMGGFVCDYCGDNLERQVNVFSHTLGMIEQKKNIGLIKTNIKNERVKLCRACRQKLRANTQFRREMGFKDDF